MKSSKIFTVHPVQRVNTEKVGFLKAVFFWDLSFTAARKTGIIDFPEKRAPTKVKYLLQVYGISQKERRENSRFAFCAHVDVIKYRKTMTFLLVRRLLLFSNLFGVC